MRTYFVYWKTTVRQGKSSEGNFTLTTDKEGGEAFKEALDVAKDNANGLEGGKLIITNINLI